MILSEYKKCDSVFDNQFLYGTMVQECVLIDPEGNSEKRRNLKCYKGSDIFGEKKMVYK